MQDLYEKFINYLEQENKDDALLFIHDLLKSNTITLDMLYDDFIRPALTEFSCKSDDEDYCIWKEHTRTSIIRTILESTYPYLIELKKNVKLNQKRIVVVCPSEEYHEVGALIITNYFTLSGFEAMFIGANTPKEDILKAVKALKPDFLALSVTNYYNLVVTKRITDSIKTDYPHVKIIVGGQAFLHSGALNSIQYDYHLNSKEDILKFGGSLYETSL